MPSRGSIVLGLTGVVEFSHVYMRDLDSAPDIVERFFQHCPLSQVVTALSFDGNAYDETPESGTFTLREATLGGAGTIISSATEASTVDIAEEFTRMIITQRSYSAAGKIITTADEMLEELIRLKR